MGSKPILYSYYRSSCSWRVRIGLLLKDIDYDLKAVNLLKAQQLDDEYSNTNPAKTVPAFQLENGKILRESLAILEYLEEAYPNKTPLLPKDHEDRAIVRGLAGYINSAIQPIQNLAVLKHLASKELDKAEWAKHWITKGFVALEKMVEKTHGKYCFKDDITLADVCLVPQVFNANRFGVDMNEFPTITKIHTALVEIDAFKNSHPSKQPDCPEEST